MLEGVLSLGAQEQEQEGQVKGASHLVPVGCRFRSSSNVSNENLLSIGHRIRLKAKI